MSLSFSRTIVTVLILSSLALSSIQAQTWTDITANVPGSLDNANSGVGCMTTDGTYLYVIGNGTTTGSAGVYRSTDGTTWEAINTVQGASYSLTNLAQRFVKYVNGIVWIGCDPGSLAITEGANTLHRLIPGQTAWQKSATNGFPGGTSTTEDVTYDATTGTYYAASALGGLYRSTDGFSWTQCHPGGPGDTALATNGVILMTLTGSPVQRSTNNGVSWYSTTAPAGQQGIMLNHKGRVLYPITGQTSPQDGLYFSDDWGLSWTQTTGPLHFNNLPGGAWDLTSDGTNVFAALGSQSRPYLRFSATDGLTWDAIPTNGLPALGNPVFPGFAPTRLIRHGDYLFTLGLVYTPSYTIKQYLMRMPLAALNFTPSLQIAVQPKTNVCLVGGSLTLTTLAGGVSPTYQWQRFDGISTYTNIPGATTNHFTLTNAQTNQTGLYRCFISDPGTNVTSSIAFAEVVQPGDGLCDPTLGRTDFSTTLGGQLFLRPGGALVAVSGNTVYRVGPNGDRTDLRNNFGTASYIANTIDSQGRLLLGGSQGNATTYRMRRVFADQPGFPDDPAFAQVIFSNGIPRAVTEVIGVGYVIVGDFNSIGTNAVNKIGMVDYNGHFVSSFNVGTGPATLNLNSVQTDKDNNVWVFGGFSSWSGVNTSQIIKLNGTNGSVAAGFTRFYSILSSDFFSAMQVLSDGSVLVCQANSGQRRLRKLFPNGGFDGSFNAANSMLSAPFLGAVEQADGKLVLTFSASSVTVFGNSVARIARLTANGLFDNSFYTTTGYSSTAYPASIVYDPRGYLFITGTSSTATFQGRSGYGTAPIRLFTTPGATTPSYATWAAGFTFPGGLSGANDDADGDGLVNFLEFAMGFNPTNAASGQLPQANGTVEVSGQLYPTLKYLRSMTASATSQIKVLNSLSGGIELGHTVASVINIGNGQEEVVIRSNASFATQPVQFLSVSFNAP